MKSLSVLFFFPFIALAQEQPTRPLGAFCSPSNPDFDEFRYEEQVPHCQRNVSRSKKEQVFFKYKIASQDRHYYEIDHYYALWIGGSNDINNLWPLRKDIHKAKTEYENFIRVKLERDQISYEEALNKMDDWLYENTKKGEN